KSTARLRALRWIPGQVRDGAAILKEGHAGSDRSGSSRGRGRILRHGEHLDKCMLLFALEATTAKTDTKGRACRRCGSAQEHAKPGPKPIMQLTQRSGCP